MEIHLHTHRHRLPENSAEISYEINKNRKSLEPLVKYSLVHFCYPSGIWSEKQIPSLEKLGICSATTCDAGLNTRKTHHLKLKRILDGESKPWIYFEAEVRGFKDIIRPIIKLFTNHNKAS